MTSNFTFLFLSCASVGPKMLLDWMSYLPCFKSSCMASNIFQKEHILRYFVCKIPYGKKQLPSGEPSYYSLIKIKGPICSCKHQDTLSILGSQAIPIYHKFIFHLSHGFMLTGILAPAQKAVNLQISLLINLWDSQTKLLSTKQITLKNVRFSLIVPAYFFHYFAKLTNSLRAFKIL